MSINDDKNNMTQSLKDEFDLREFFLFLVRHKILILSSSIVGFLISCLYAFSTAKIWQGQFQIVIEDKSDSKLSNFDLGGSNSFLKLTGLNKSKGLETDVEILQSPSILLDIFNFVQASDSKQYEAQRFKDWKTNLSVAVKEKTSVLDIYYKDKNKELVIPVLEKISKKYQQYSGKKRLRNIELANSYYEDQIKIYKSKSKKSREKLIDFALENNISTNMDNLVSGSKLIEGTSSRIPSINVIKSPLLLDIETLRLQSLAKIKILNEKKDQVSNINTNLDQIYYIGIDIPEILNTSEIFKKIKLIDDLIFDKRLIYKDSDPSLIKLTKKRNNYLLEFKKEIIANLQNSILNENVKLKALYRPKTINAEYLGLLSKAIIDKNTLDSIEANYRLVLLEKARQNDPWELITSPSIFPYPIWPAKKNIVFLGLSSSLFLSFIIGYIMDKVNGKIYSDKILKSEFKFPIFTKLSLDEKTKWQQKINLLISSKLSLIKEDLSILYLGEIAEDILNLLKEIFSSSFKNTKLNITNDLLEFNKFKNKLVILPLGKLKYKVLDEFNEFIDVKDSNIVGGIVIDLNQYISINKSQIMNLKEKFTKKND